MRASTANTYTVKLQSKHIFTVVRKQRNLITASLLLGYKQITNMCRP